MDIKNLVNVTKDPYGDHYLFIKDHVSKGISFKIPIRISPENIIQVKINKKYINLSSIKSLIYYGPFGKPSGVREIKFPIYDDDKVEIKIEIGETKVIKKGYFKKILFKNLEFKNKEGFSKVKFINIYIKILEFGKTRESEELRAQLEDLDYIKDKLLKTIDRYITHKDEKLIETIYEYISGLKPPIDFKNQREILINRVLNYKNDLLIIIVVLNVLGWYSRKTSVKQIIKYQFEIEEYFKNIKYCLTNNIDLVFDPNIIIIS